MRVVLDSAYPVVTLYRRCEIEPVLYVLRRMFPAARFGADHGALSTSHVIYTTDSDPTIPTVAEAIRDGFQLGKGHRIV